MHDQLLILVVEDNHDIAENIMLCLENSGHQVDAIHSGRRAMTLLEQNDYDVIILDVMLPGIDGFTLAKRIRNQLLLTTPILFLTARDTLEDKVEGFSRGGDDYLTKPFEMLELEMRVDALGKRARGAIINQITIGDWLIDVSRMEIFVGNQPIKTTQIGFKILKNLAQNFPKMVTKRELERALWGEQPPESDALRSHIFALRKAIKQAGEEPILETVHGVGFRLNITQTR